MLFEPAVQHIGVHAMAVGQGRDGSSRFQASGNQFRLEGWGVGSEGTPGGVSRNVRVFEHGVHDGLRAHDVARRRESHQDGFTARLRTTT